MVGAYRLQIRVFPSLETQYYYCVLSWPPIISGVQFIFHDTREAQH